MSGLLSSVRWAAVAQASKIAGQLVSLAVLSRLLPPADYGVMAMAGVVTALAGMLRDMGTGAAIIQRKELTPELTSTVFWMIAALGAGLGLLLCLSSGVLGSFFHEPQLPGVLIALAISFPLGSLTAVHQAMVERRSGFKTLAMLDVTNQVAGLLFAIVAALAGAGVYSLVVPTLVQTVISSIWLWQVSGWRPGWGWSAAEFKGIWGFSGNLTAFQFLVYFARNADSLIIGRMLGAAPLGVYSMAYKLMLFPVQNMTWVIGRVLLPRLSQMQDDPVRIRELYFKALGAVVTLSAPAMAGLWALREPFVVVAFGPRWVEVPDLVAWLAPVGLLQSMTSTVGTVFMAAGRTQTLFRLGLANTAVLLVAFVVGAKLGLLYVAIAYAIANVITGAQMAWLTGKLLHATVRDLWTAIRAPLLSGVLMAAGMSLMLAYVAPFGYAAPIECVGVGAAGAALYGVCMKVIFRQSLRPILAFIRAKG